MQRELKKSVEQVAFELPFEYKLLIVQIHSWNAEKLALLNAVTCQNVWNMSAFEPIFKGLSLYLEARIWIRI